MVSIKFAIIRDHLKDYCIFYVILLQYFSFVKINNKYSYFTSLDYRLWLKLIGPFFHSLNREWIIMQVIFLFILKTTIITVTF